MKEGSDIIILKTGIDPTYRAEKWGLERIILDGISNHFPADSKGTQYWVKFKQNNTYVDFRKYNPALPVSEILIEDDGSGYDYMHLRHLGSEKRNNPETTGKYGEGLKLISTASLRKNVDLELGSQDWYAKPIWVKEQGRTKVFQELAFEVNVTPHWRKGSYTKIRNPSQELVKHALEIQKNVLDFRHDILGLDSFKQDSNKIYFSESTEEIFLNKIRFETTIRFRFTYCLQGDDLVPADRDEFNDWDVRRSIERLILHMNESKDIAKLLKIVSKDPLMDLHYENKLFSFEVLEHDSIPTQKQVWLDAFYETFGKEALLSSGQEIDVLLKSQQPIAKLPQGWMKLFSKMGIESTAQILKVPTRFDLVSLDNLSQEQRERYEKYKTLDKILGIPDDVLPPLIFSKAYAENIETEFGVGFTNIEDGQRYYKQKVLDSDEAFAQVHDHESAHMVSRATDITKEFEIQQTIQGGKSGAEILRLQKENNELKKEINDLEFEVEKNR